MAEDYIRPEIEAFFPNLRKGEYRKTSEDDPVYNCIAHAAEASDAWWWPAQGPGIYWPPEAEMTETVEGFIQAYASVGYEVCQASDRSLERGVQKVALYVDDDGVPTHAARQLASGDWTSKLGRAEDILHKTLEALEGSGSHLPGYGTAAIILRRSIST